MASLKTCFKCGIAKAISDFYRHPAMGDGFLGKCKECTKHDVAEHRELNIESVRAYDKQRANLPHRKEMRLRIVSGYNQLFPDRKKANTMVHNALRSGELQRQPCWVCGSKAVAHHPDYSRPLDVVWLCQAHHKQAHALVA